MFQDGKSQAGKELVQHELEGLCASEAREMIKAEQEAVRILKERAEELNSGDIADSNDIAYIMRVLAIILGRLYGVDDR